MKAVVVPPGAGRFIAVGAAGTGVTIKASDAETGGLCSVWEGEVPPGAVGAGPHYHHGIDEFFYVLEGELMIRIGNEHHTAPRGTFAFVPRETIHGFHNASSEAARVLVMHHPAGFERFFDEMGELVARQGTKEERAALAARFDIFPVRPLPAT
jgi:uncharacterized cupin superfamily protein